MPEIARRNPGVVMAACTATALAASAVRDTPAESAGLAVVALVIIVAAVFARRVKDERDPQSRTVQ